MLTKLLGHTSGGPTQKLWYFRGCTAVCALQAIPEQLVSQLVLDASYSTAELKLASRIQRRFICLMAVAVCFLTFYTSGGDTMTEMVMVSHDRNSETGRLACNKTRLFLGLESYSRQSTASQSVWHDAQHIAVVVTPGSTSHSVALPGIAFALHTVSFA